MAPRFSNVALEMGKHVCFKLTILHNYSNFFSLNKLHYDCQYIYIYISVNLSIAQIIGPIIKIFLFQFCEGGERKGSVLEMLEKQIKMKYNKHLG